MKIFYLIHVLFIFFFLNCFKAKRVPYDIQTPLGFFLNLSHIISLKPAPFSDANTNTVEAPFFVPSPGHYSTPHFISMQSNTTGATIHFTLDGSEPTVNSPLFTESIHIWGIAGKTIQSFAKKSEITNSIVVSGVFSYSNLKTGQIQCWNGSGNPISCSNTKMDGELQRGVTKNYSDNSNGTITDHATGLVWQRCPAGTDLISCIGISAGYTWDSARNYCNTLNIAGRKWRLPTRRELMTLLNYAGSNYIDITYFPNSATSLWSDSDYASDTNYAWKVDFGTGHVNQSHKTYSSLSVRCVSGEKRTEPNHFTDNGDGTVRDNTTGLIWQKCSYGQDPPSCTSSLTMDNWENAVSYCKNLDLASRSWRLPNINELNSLVDVTRYEPTIHPAFFLGTGQDNYWSSTTDSPTAAFFTNFQHGTVSSNSKTTFYNYIRCVTD